MFYEQGLYINFGLLHSDQHSNSNSNSNSMEGLSSSDAFVATRYAKYVFGLCSHYH